MIIFKKLRQKLIRYFFGCDEENIPKYIFDTNTQIGMKYLTGRVNSAMQDWFKILRTAKISDLLVSANISTVFLGHFWQSALGHILLLDGLAKHQILSKRGEKICFLDSKLKANIYLLSIWKEKYKNLNLLSAQTNKKIVFEKMFPILSERGEIKFFCNIFNDIEKKWVEKKYSPLLRPIHDFDRDKELEKLNPKKLAIICIHVREVGFYSEHNNLRYGRNANIDDLNDSIDWLISQGNFVVRLGDKSMRKLKSRENLFDYAHSPIKSEENDIIIPSKSVMMVCGNSGYTIFPINFGIPAAYINHMPLGCTPWNKKAFLIHKKYYCKKKERYLHYDEIIPPPLGHVESLSFFKKHNIQLIDNTPIEILRCIQNTYTKYVLKKQVNDAGLLQDKLESIAESCGSYIGPSICPDFLRGNLVLLKRTALGARLKPLRSKKSFVSAFSEISNMRHLRFRLKGVQFIKTKKIRFEASYLLATNEIIRAKKRLLILRKLRPDWKKHIKNVESNLKTKLEPAKIRIPFYEFLEKKCVKKYIPIHDRLSFRIAQAMFHREKILKCKVTNKIKEYTDHFLRAWGEQKSSFEYSRKVVFASRVLDLKKAHDLISSQIKSNGVNYLSGHAIQALATWRSLILRLAEIQNELDSKKPQKKRIRYLSHGWTPAIGHIGLIDFYTKLMKLGLIGKSQVEICVHPQDRAGNSHLLGYWAKFYKILDHSTVKKQWGNIRYFEVPMALHPMASGDCLFYSHAAALAQVEWEKKGLSPLLALQSEDHAFGLDVLAKKNISPADWFVALHIREPGFHNQWADPLRKGRDVDIYTYLDAIQEITRAGGWVIRMGDPTMKPLPPMERVWDYAHSPDRSERMDVFLLANCRFFVGTNTGVSYVPPVFGRPCLYTNWCALDHRPWWSQNLLIHKNIRERKSGDLLPYSRMIPPPFGHIESIEYLHSQGLDLVDNTAGEILAAVIEMMQYVEKTPNQEKVLSMANKTYQQIAVEAGGYAGPRICETFLDKYPQLLK